METHVTYMSRCHRQRQQSGISNISLNVKSQCCELYSGWPKWLWVPTGTSGWKAMGKIPLASPDDSPRKGQRASSFQVLVHFRNKFMPALDYFFLDSSTHDLIFQHILFIVGRLGAYGHQWVVNLQELILSFHRVGPRNWTEVIRLGNGCFYSKPSHQTLFEFF